MPTYDYVCDSCGHEFEAYESIKADPQKTCPNCAKDTLRRKIGPGAAILFKGSGFYITDYRSDSYKAKAKADSSGGSDSAKPDAGSKPADKSSASPATPTSGGSPSSSSSSSSGPSKPSS